MFTRLCYGMGKDMPFNYSKFICDKVSDLATLPTSVAKSSTNKDIDKCSIGSVALVIETRSAYILSNENQWVLFQDNTGGVIVLPDGSTIDVASLTELKSYIA